MEDGSSPGAPSPRILAFAASTRSDSFNRRILRIAVHGAEAAGVACTVLDLRDHPLPIYDADLERDQGLPEAANRLRVLLASHQGLLIASPEYNGFVSPLLKNTLDWISRSPEGRPDLAPFQGKVAALMAASPGPLGGIRGLALLRQLLANLGVTALADQVTLREAHAHFDEGGALRDERLRGWIEALGRTLASWLLRRAGPMGPPM
jgi:chromate reductase